MRCFGAVFNQHCAEVAMRLADIHTASDHAQQATTLRQDISPPSYVYLLAIRIDRMYPQEVHDLPTGDDHIGG